MKHRSYSGGCQIEDLGLPANPKTSQIGASVADGLLRGGAAALQVGPDLVEIGQVAA
jgi:hypothetical protein